MGYEGFNFDDPLFDPQPKRSCGGCGSCGSGKAAEGLSRCGNGLEKIYPTTAVRFGYMRYIGEFSHIPDMRFTCGAKVIIETRRGIEVGEQVSLTCGGCDKSVTRDEMKAWVGACGEDSFIFDAGRILREATAADLAEWAHIQNDCRARCEFAQKLADRHQLPLRIIECECTFGGERVIYFFTAAERVDFRGLVKDLAREYRTRIEMRQVGARDEARLLADFETCGREVCCKVFLKTLRPISMRMAKVQKATMDPTQVSGRCGRLKCCLRYEHVAYEELDRRLPRIGARIRTAHGDGVVVNRQILTQLVQLEVGPDRLITVVAEDILKEGETRPSVKEPPAGEQEDGGEPLGREATTRGTARPDSTRPRRPGHRERRPPPPESTEGSQETGASEEPESRPSEEGGVPRRPRRRRRRRRRGGPEPREGDGPAEGGQP